ncbi:MAG: LLM class F420-dependent oxidoreductase [Chloroflexi bacterium]|nr:LLM class F420-dependent oxidoreductase [Chloroflexota bacterium]
MKIGLSFFGLGIKSYPIIAQKAEEVGFESLWVSEHLVFPADIPPTYPYTEDGRPPVTSNTPLMDPWVLLSFVAASTSKVRLGTGVYILPLRNPFVTARAVCTLDRLSSGRAILGVGIGWLKEEFEAVGERWDNRGERSLEIVEIIRKLWTEPVIEHHGKHYSFGPVKFEPKPAQKPHPPIEFGGETPAALRRAGTHGDGWIATGGHTPDSVRQSIRRITEARKSVGRDRLPFDVTIVSRGEPKVDEVKRFEEAGVTRVFIRPVMRAGVDKIGLPDLLGRLDHLGEHLISKV